MRTGCTGDALSHVSSEQIVPNLGEDYMTCDLYKLMYMRTVGLVVLVWAASGRGGVEQALRAWREKPKAVRDAVCGGFLKQAGCCGKRI